MTMRPHFPLGPRLAAAIAAVPALLLAADALAQSCAMCGSSFGENDPVSRAFSWSILFMMAAPYTIVGTIAAILFYLHRRAPGRRRASIIDLGKAARLMRRRLAEREGDIA
jgi:hypothetical protein